MSAASHDAHHAHDDHEHGEGGAHGTLKDYVIGFVLAVILTAIPFWLVMADVLPSHQMTAVAVMGLAAIQVIVHMIYFLHMNSRSEGGWTMLALVFTLIIVVITLAGSMWVMHNLDTHMMAPAPHEMREVP
ncbi:cytochrome o ubiquinol oxidase subunit IV [Caulobacter endophyticus]|uniref:Cytochrome bo(3) ubiquinol oxidase subunit 4 n=1 Tax=Caulobacter endophyticus TaxID=2172652 RepID=A0A2T9KAC1_9CAUL|nr:cytochrome o ubiquinol oxidase subunit IV [Caulobacter endophyticus]PVM92922.1 cytochrome o ubiquinol oxidase subunit IV [Caulobacter endophyticus]